MKFVFLALFVFGLNAQAANNVHTNVPPENSEANLALADANSKLPIIYGVGGGGITWQTRYSEAETKLSISLHSPTPFGDVIYEEGMDVRWDFKGPVTIPLLMTFKKNYQGPLERPAPQLPIYLNQEIPGNYARGTVEGATEMVRELYRTFEKADSDYDCIDKRTCKVDWGMSAQTGFIIFLPSMRILISKERFVPSRFIMTPVY